MQKEYFFFEFFGKSDRFARFSSLYGFSLGSGSIIFVSEPSKIIKVNASEIMAKIENGSDINYHNVVIEGDLNLNDLCLNKVKLDRSNPPTGKESKIGNWLETKDLPQYTTDVKIVSSNINIENAEIRGNINMENAFFNNSLNFNNVLFKGYVSFPYSIYEKNVNFEDCIFNENADFWLSHFNGDASFDGSAFNQTSYFAESEFNKSVNFANCNFSGIARFEESLFYGNANFLKSIFNQKSFFIGSRFNNNLNFGLWSSFFDDNANKGHSIFHGDADFSGSMFNGYADFAGSFFGENTNFDQTYFRKAAYFGFSEFNKSADFSGTIFRSGADFNSSQFNGDIQFRGTKFLDFLNLTDLKFKILDIYLPSGTDLFCDGLTYSKLIKNFRDLENYEIADDIYIRHREWQQNQRQFWDIYKYIDLLASQTCGYGIRPDKTVRFGIIVLVSFSILYFCIISRRKQEKRFKEKLIESLCFSTIVLLSVPKELYPLKDGTYEEYAANIKYWPILERIFGWGLLLLLINALSRIMIRY